MIDFDLLFNRLCEKDVIPSNYRLSGTGGYLPEIYIYDEEWKTTWYGEKYSSRRYVAKLAPYPVDNRLIVLELENGSGKGRQTLLDPGLPDFIDTLLQRIS